jgi:uncharacterized Ntn-hydrolase superfamily protein
MKTKTTLSCLAGLMCTAASLAQDTFSIVAVDSVTKEVGSAGASCVDMFNLPQYTTDFLGELFPGVGAINTQAAYDATNQKNARDRMNAGDSPQQIINYVTANDAAGNPTTRQYGIVRLINGKPVSAGYTGTNCQNYKNHIAGPNYCIQGNILLGKQILDSMEARFKREPGDLACKLMAALQGAKVVGADTRCAPNNTSTLFAFVKVSKTTDTFGNPYILYSVKTKNNAKIEPIDSLQKIFSKARSCSATGIVQATSSVYEVAIAPVPAQNILNISVSGSAGDANHFTVKNALGQEIFSGSLTGAAELNISSWESGVYILEATDGISVVRKKFIKI